MASMDGITLTHRTKDVADSRVYVATEEASDASGLEESGARQRLKVCVDRSTPPYSSGPSLTRHCSIEVYSVPSHHRIYCKPAIILGVHRGFVSGRFD